MSNFRHAGVPENMVPLNAAVSVPEPSEASLEPWLATPLIPDPSSPFSLDWCADGSSGFPLAVPPFCETPAPRPPPAPPPPVRMPLVPSPLSGQPPLEGAEPPWATADPQIIAAAAYRLAARLALRPEDFDPSLSMPSPGPTTVPAPACADPLRGRTLSVASSTASPPSARSPSTSIKGSDPDASDSATSHSKSRTPRPKEGAPGLVPEGGRNVAPQELRRPCNAFMLFSNAFRKKVANENPELTNVQVSRLLGTMWKALTQEEKDSYAEMARKARREFDEQHPDVKFTNKKRSITRFRKRKSEEVLTLVEHGGPVLHQRPRTLSVPVQPSVPVLVVPVPCSWPAAPDPYAVSPVAGRPTVAVPRAGGVLMPLAEAAPALSGLPLAMFPPRPSPPAFLPQIRHSPPRSSSFFSSAVAAAAADPLPFGFMPRGRRSREVLVPPPEPAPSRSSSSRFSR